jgi:hypothetical protein
MVTKTDKDVYAEEVMSEGVMPLQTPTITAGAYAAGDAVGGLLTFEFAARVEGRGGFVKNVLIIDNHGQDAELELWLFKETFTAMVDNEAWAPSVADLKKLVAIISTASGAWFAAGTPSVARIPVSQYFELTGTSLFGQVVNRGTPTWNAVNDLTVILGLPQD